MRLIGLWTEILIERVSKHPQGHRLRPVVTYLSTDQPELPAGIEDDVVHVKTK